MVNDKMKAKEWFEKARHDLEAVDDILKGSGHADVAGVLLQQSIEKYLKGFLISKGWELVKTHDLKQLLDEIVKHNSVFGKYYDLLDMLTEYYFEEKYPLGETEVLLDEVKDNLKEAKKLISAIKQDFKKK
ncbi:MAG: HEPN domain-containing protein [Candidatus Omnitrophota bacterium]